jgi:hypothetical protein
VALSSNSASVVVPATAKIAAGKTTGTFTFKPRKVKKTTKAQVSAAYGGATVTAAFTVKK